MTEIINKSDSKTTKNALVLLSIVIGLAFVVRFYYFPYEIPITLDGFRFFLYAMDTIVLGQLPPVLPNNGWPLFFSIFVSTIRFENYLDYVALQRVLTIIFSVATAVPTFLICKKFFDKTVAVVGAALFVFTPRVIQNSLGGTSDPLFILLITTSVFLFLCKNKTAVYISFFVLALASLVRYEGLLLIIPFSVFFVIRFKKEPKVALKYLMVLGIFIITTLPLAYLRTEATGHDGLLSNVLAGVKVSVTDGSIMKDTNAKFSLQTGIIDLVKYLGAAFFPLFFIFIPYGLYAVFKNRSQTGSIITIGIFMLIPAVYAYGRSFQDPRYVFVVLPLAAFVALYSVEKITTKLRRKNLVAILIVSAIILSSIAYLEFKKIDYEHEKEAVRLAQFIHELDGSINEFSHESSYVETAGLYGVKLPVLRSDIDFGPKVIPLNGESVEEFLVTGKEKDLTYLVVDSLNTKTARKSFLNDIFYHEENYPYLVKIFDSNENGYSYKVKIFKIDYDRFESIKK
jgi:hypothetical protein